MPGILRDENRAGGDGMGGDQAIVAAAGKRQGTIGRRLSLSKGQKLDIEQEIHERLVRWTKAARHPDAQFGKDDTADRQITGPGVPHTLGQSEMAAGEKIDAAVRVEMITGSQRLAPFRRRPVPLSLFKLALVRRAGTHVGRRSCEATRIDLSSSA